MRSFAFLRLLLCIIGLFAARHCERQRGSSRQQVTNHTTLYTHYCLLDIIQDVPVSEIRKIIKGPALKQKVNYLHAPSFKLGVSLASMSVSL